MFSRFVIFIIFFLLPIASYATTQTQECTGYKTVCSFSRYVLKLVNGNTIATAVYWDRGWVVTNRHLLIGTSEVLLEMTNGDSFSARVMVSGYQGDLILLAVEGLDLGNPVPLATKIRSGTPLHVLAIDRHTSVVKLSKTGRLILPAIQDKPLTRFQHDAPAAVGSDGGAVITQDGRLIGIATAGNQKRGEAIPISQVMEMSHQVGEEFRPTHNKIEDAYRRCMDTLRRMPKRRARLARRAVSYLKEACLSTKNSHFIEEAARILGRAGNISEARGMFSAVLNDDPHSIGARISLVIILLLSGAYEEAIPHLKWLRSIVPDDTDVMRLAIQAGKYSGNLDFAEEALYSLDSIDPSLSLPMRRLMNMAIPSRKLN